jgi:hypothetical protein
MCPLKSNSGSLLANIEVLGRQRLRDWAVALGGLHSFELVPPAFLPVFYCTRIECRPPYFRGLAKTSPTLSLP